ncbi:OLC1v1001830C1 [Oldenlandia corymbosa var. corymbosa]|uniref:OLC1v1001830C1 n=1 Tax=Oldenlandia corymbosa var. corymbosa TaxID=529605 RepID=A0AAV1D8I4_OLDCO|nr:OLC1v1001830C1 [Oldenlandia corymbosa var. corymbosa]
MADKGFEAHQAKIAEVQAMLEKVNKEIREMEVTLMLLECIGNEDKINSLSDADWNDVIDLAQKQMLELRRNVANPNLQDSEEADQPPPPGEGVDPGLAPALADGEKVKVPAETVVDGDDAPTKSG